MHYLGHIVSAEEIGFDPEMIRSVSDWPTNWSSSLGLLNSYC